MPLYVYACKYDHRAELMRPLPDYNKPLRCKFCGEPATLIIVGSSPHLFPSGMWEDVDIHPVEITSKKQLERECRKRGIFARNYMEHYSPSERLIKWGG